MSLKFNYNSNTYIYIPVLRNASIDIADQINYNHESDADFRREVYSRLDTFPRTAHYITYSEVLNLENYDGTETFFSVVRHPMDRCVSLYNFIRSQGWVSDTNFNTYWTDVINNQNHDASVSIGARTSTLQRDIVNTNGTIYKFETDLPQITSDFNLTEIVEETKESNVVVDSDKEAVRSLIESHFDADYTTFGYNKGE